MRDPRSFYTYGIAPPTLWPMTNPPPLSQLQLEEDAEITGEDVPVELATGGIAEAGPLSVLLEGGAPKADGALSGVSSGRADDIDARLSPGEYVIDAETVALLGDGNTDAGAAALDQMREAIRSHKGKALAKGKFSPAAKSPLEYLLGDE